MSEMTVAKLAWALNEAIFTRTLQDSDVLERNDVGNLAVYRDGVYVGFIDLGIGEVNMFEEAGE
jgi:hypothetical protein